MLIRLREQSTRELILVNTDHVVCVSPYKGGSDLTLSNRTGRQVVETPEQILGMAQPLSCGEDVEVSRQALSAAVLAWWTERKAASP